MSKNKLTDGMTEYETGDSALCLTALRKKRKEKLHDNHFEKLRQNRTKMKESKDEVHANMSTLGRLSR